MEPAARYFCCILVKYKRLGRESFYFSVIQWAVLYLLISRKKMVSFFSIFLLNLYSRTLNSDFNFAISLKETSKHSCLRRDSRHNLVLQNWGDAVPEFTNLLRVSSQTLSEGGINHTNLSVASQKENQSRFCPTNLFQPYICIFLLMLFFLLCSLVQGSGCQG